MLNFARNALGTVAKTVAQQKLKNAGIEVNGNRPFDIQVHDERLYTRTLLGGSLGLGESYTDGDWDCERLDLFFERLLRADVSEGLNFVKSVLAARARWTNLQSRKRAHEVIDRHYDLDPEWYEGFLDPNMQYTCGYFKEGEGPEALNAAQVRKMDLACRKLGLKEGDRLLDIGCGWGGLAKYAAEHYGAQVTGVTLSGEQADYARCFTQGHSVEIRTQDYREIEGEFDAIVSIGMIEAVGHKNFRALMKKAHDVLVDEGLFLLHTIGSDKSTTHTNPWMHKYIFPNGMIPSQAQLATAAEGFFRLEDVHNFGPDYVKTLMAWDANFQKNWETLKNKCRNPEEARRIWHYYFMSCAGGFRSRHMQLWQMVYSKGRRTEKYEAVR